MALTTGSKHVLAEHKHCGVQRARPVGLQTSRQRGGRKAAVCLLDKHSDTRTPNGLKLLQK